MSQREVNVSSQALYDYIRILDEYINNVAQQLLEITTKNTQAAQYWQDQLYTEFSDVINATKIKLTNDLIQLRNLKNLVKQKADEVAEIERIRF